MQTFTKAEVKGMPISSSKSSKVKVMVSSQHVGTGPIFFSFNRD